MTVGSSKSHPRTSKSRPGGSKSHSRGSKSGPRRLRKAPQEHQKRPKGPKYDFGCFRGGARKASGNLRGALGAPFGSSGAPLWSSGATFGEQKCLRGLKKRKSEIIKIPLVFPSQIVCGGSRRGQKVVRSGVKWWSEVV